MLLHSLSPHQARSQDRACFFLDLFRTAWQANETASVHSMAELAVGAASCAAISLGATTAGRSWTACCGGGAPGCRTDPRPSSAHWSRQTRGVVVTIVIS